MTLPRPKTLRCAIYTRKSSEEGLEQDFNSLHAQREACEAYIKSQRHEGWSLVKTSYDDGGFSGGNINRPALKQLMDDIDAGLIDIIMVYKVDRLSRSLADFSRMVEQFETSGVSFVSITQQFNTSTSMGRLTLNVLLSFAQFEREVTGERIRDKIAASKKKGLWMGGPVPLGYDVIDRALVINRQESLRVAHIYERYRILQSVKLLKEELDQQQVFNKPSKAYPNGRSFSRGGLYTLLKNPLYIGKVQHKEKLYPGQHQRIIETALWDEVQKILTKNRHTKYLRTHAKEPSLLTGLLFDDEGNFFSPTHTRKKNRRYRYYVNQLKVQFKQSHPDALLRVPAQPVETTVESAVIRLLNDQPTLQSQLADYALSRSAQTSLLDKAQSIAAGWPKLKNHQKIDYLNHILDKVRLNRTSIQIEYLKSGLLKILLPNFKRESITKSDHIKNFTVSLPTILQRCGVETKLIIQKPSAQQDLKPHSESITAIQEALKKAIRWNQALLDGLAKSTAELADQEQVSQSYITQIIKLAYLAPEIMNRIFEGDIPHEMTLGSLKKRIPLDWSEQKALFLAAE